MSSEQHLSVDKFFERLVGLFDSNAAKSHGSVFLSQKRMTYGSDITPFTAQKGQTDTLADLSPSASLPVLIRASNGDSRDKSKSKIKISCLIQSDDLEPFYARYADVCKGAMTGLKKRDRKARKNRAKKRKGAVADPEKQG